MRLLTCATILAAINLTIYEDGLTFPTAFAKTYLPSDEKPKRVSISPKDIKRVRKVCLDVADERRRIIALIYDTGMRLSEALELVLEDIINQYQYPHKNLFHIRGGHFKWRTVKHLFHL